MHLKLIALQIYIPTSKSQQTMVMGSNASRHTRDDCACEPGSAVNSSSLALDSHNSGACQAYPALGVMFLSGRPPSSILGVVIRHKLDGEVSDGVTMHET